MKLFDNVLISLLIFFSLSLFNKGRADVPFAVQSIAPYLVRIETIGGHEKVGNEFASGGTSTGMLLDQEGSILTSSFHFLHDPTTILVILPDGTKKAAQRRAADHLRMLTLLKIEGVSGNMSPIPYRTKDSVRIGERCIAVGTVLSPDKPNVALGIISGKNRIWGKAIQTDASISHNNYGGLLIDLEGNAVGMPVPLSMMSDNVAAGADMYDAGIGMCIPWEDILTILPRLKEGNDLHIGIAGIGFKDNQIFVGKPVIASVVPNSPAEKAGIKVGDTIVSIDGMPMVSALDVTKNLRLRYAGETLTLIFRRKETEQCEKEQAVTLTTVTPESLKTEP